MICGLCWKRAHRRVGLWARVEVYVAKATIRRTRQTGGIAVARNTKRFSDPTKFRAHLPHWARCRVRGAHLTVEPSWTSLAFLGAAETSDARVGACHARDWRRCALLTVTAWQARRACHLAQVPLETASRAVGARAQVRLVAVGASRTLLRTFGPLLAIMTWLGLGLGLGTLTLTPNPIPNPNPNPNPNDLSGNQSSLPR